MCPISVALFERFTVYSAKMAEPIDGKASNRLRYTLSVCDVVFYHHADFFKSIPISEVQNDIKFHSYSFRNDNQFLKVENEANESNRESNFCKSFDNPS